VVSRESNIFTELEVISDSSLQGFLLNQDILNSPAIDYSGDSALAKTEIRPKENLQIYSEFGLASCFYEASDFPAVNRYPFPK